jgi:hypothetical protein
VSILCTHVVECIGNQIIHDNGGQLLMEEILSFVSFLLLVMGYNKTSRWSNIDEPLFYTNLKNGSCHTVKSKNKDL